ncbi:hypothetical protein P4C99_06115 [Pontiellaceae bacterium B1224]|nr:hypothetical protein [Pontiellaceae bacterium B1224]
MKNRTAITGITWCAAMLLGAVSAQAIVWNNNLGDNVMTNNGNWAEDLSSSSYLDFNLSGTDRAILSDGMSLTVNDVRVGMSAADLTGEIEIAGGVLRAQRTTGDCRIGYAGRTGIVNQSGGLFEVNHTMVIGFDGTGIYNLSGGTLDNQRENFVVDGASSIITISGGTLLTAANARMRDSGTFRVEGTGASSIQIGGSASGNGTWGQNTGGLLDILIDGTATGVTKIEVVGVDGDVTFDTASYLNVDFAGAENLGTFVVMEWDGEVLANNLAFDPSVDTDVWSFNVDEANKQLTVTAIPEPATLGLVAAFGGTVLFIRRRFMI